MMIIKDEDEDHFYVSITTVIKICRSVDLRHLCSIQLYSSMSSVMFILGKGDIGLLAGLDVGGQGSSEKGKRLFLLYVHACSA